MLRHLYCWLLNQTGIEAIFVDSKDLGTSILVLNQEGKIVLSCWISRKHTLNEFSAQINFKSLVVLNHLCLICDLSYLIFTQKLSWIRWTLFKINTCLIVVHILLRATFCETNKLIQQQVGWFVTVGTIILRNWNTSLTQQWDSA